MKFRFCGDSDCPDWILAEIHSELSLLSSVKLRILAQIVAKSIVGEEIPEEKVRDIFAANKNDLGTAKAAIACIRFLLTSAARHNCDDATFGEELQQLGLPKEHSTALCRVLNEFLKVIRNKLAENSLKINELGEVSCSIPEKTIDCVQLNFAINNEIVNGVSQRTSHSVNIQKIDLAILLNELKAIRVLMDDYSYERKYAEN